MDEKDAAQIATIVEAAVSKKATTQNVNMGTVFQGLPAWITLISIMVLGFINLHSRLSTVEYQNTVSIQDRAEIHRRADAEADNYSQVKSDLAEIKVTLKQLTLESQTRQYSDTRSARADETRQPAAPVTP